MTEEYEVGYRKPPKANRFQKGQSGNPRGRSKGTRNLKTDLLDELAERISIKEGDRPLRVSKQRALLKTLMARGMKGDTRAAGLILNIVWRILEKETPPDPVMGLSADDQSILKEFTRRQLARQSRESNDE